MSTEDGTWRMVVDGEEFDVVKAEDQVATYHFDWLSHPHGYGFTSGYGVYGTSSRAEHDAVLATLTMSEDEMRMEIHDFLEGIDPETGYLAD